MVDDKCTFYVLLLFNFFTSLNSRKFIKFLFYYKVKQTKTNVYRNTEIVSHLLLTHLLMRMCNAESQKGQQKVQILKRRQGLCPSRSYHSIWLYLTACSAISRFSISVGSTCLITKTTGLTNKFKRKGDLWILIS